MPDSFWSSNTIDPKRAYRWMLILDHLPAYTIKAAAKPGFVISNVAHQFMAHTFNFPGRITWDNVEVTLIDPVSPDSSAKLVKILQASGYAVPGTEAAAKRSFSKAAATAALGQPTIQQVDAAGRPVDKWTLKNAWIENVKFGTALNYTTEDMVDITMSLRFDWAEYEGLDKAGQQVPSLIMGAGPDQDDIIKTYRKQLGAEIAVVGGDV